MLIEKQCDHKGRWKPLGQSTETLYVKHYGGAKKADHYEPEGSQTKASIYCSECGIIKSEIL